jgi:signal transduction histidine kinase
VRAITWGQRSDPSVPPGSPASRHRRAVAAVVALGTVVGLAGAGALLGVRNGSVAGGWSPVEAALGGLLQVAAVVAGILILSRRRRNSIGCLLVVFGGASAVHGVVRELATWRLVELADRGPFTLALAWMASWLWVLPFVMIAALLVELPDGEPPGRWRWLRRAITVATAGMVVALTLHPELLIDQLPTVVDNPVGFVPRAVAEAAVMAGFAVVFVSALSGTVGLLLRYRRGDATTRRQLLLLLVVGVAMLVLTWLPTPDVLFLVGMLGVPVAILVSTLRYRLYAVDRVVGQALALTALTSLVAALYLATTAVAGAAVAEGGRGTLVAVAATATVALFLQPVRVRTDRAIHRLVHGRQPSRLQLLEAVAEVAAGPIDAVPDRLAALLRSATPDTVAASVTVTLPEGGSETRTSAPRRVRGAGSEGEDLGERPTLLETPVVCDGGEVGSLRLHLLAGSPTDEEDVALLRALAAAVGPALRNVAMHAALAEHAHRLITAHDEERRRIERDIHDGAQQQLIAAATHLGLARQLTEDDTSSLQLTRAGELLTAAMRDLRAIVRGLRPAALADHGICVALRDHASTTSLGYHLDVIGEIRFEHTVEATLYWCGREALQNVTKHAGATVVVAEVTDDDGTAQLVVRDDGCGFDPGTVHGGGGWRNLGDRLAAVGGSFHLDSRPDAGTALTVRVPLDRRGTAAPPGPGGAAPVPARGQAC